MLPMIDKSGRGQMAAGTTEPWIVRERLGKQYFAASFGGARLRRQPPRRSETRIRQEIDVLNVDDDSVEQRRRGLGAAELVDDDVADEITQRRHPPVMTVRGQIARTPEAWDPDR